MQIRFSALLFISMSCSMNAMDGVEVAPSSTMQKVPSWDDVYSILKTRSVDDLDKLVERGFSLDEHDEFDDTLLHKVVCTGSTEMLMRVVSQPNLDINAPGNRNQPALHLAAQRNDVECVSLLIDNGASLIARGTFRRTPLHVAAWYGHADVALVLLSHMSVPDQENIINEVADEYGQTPLALAHGQGHAALIQLFTDYSLRQQKIEALLKKVGKE